MNEQDYLNSKHSCYALAHTIAINGIIQQKLINELRNIEINEIGYDKIIKAMLKTLVSNFT